MEKGEGKKLVIGAVHGCFTLKWLDGGFDVYTVYTPCYQVDPAPFSHIIIDPFALLSDSTDAVIVEVAPHAHIFNPHTHNGHMQPQENISLNRWWCKQIEYKIVYMLYFYSRSTPNYAHNINTTQ